MERLIVDGEPNEVTEIRHKILTEFADLTFDPVPHIYTLNGKVIPSVTTIIKQFEHEFDEETISENYAEKHGETPEYWREKWKYANLISTTTGTLVHEFGESMGWLRNGHPELITDSCKMKYIKDRNWLIPTRKKEEAIIKFFDELPKDFHFVLNETKVYTGKNRSITDLKQDICGTFDLLYYYKHPTDDSKSGLVIFDWKTNKELTKQFNIENGKMLLPPFDDLVEQPKSVYSLQLSAYQLPLEDIGLKVIGRRIVWLKDDGTYEKFSTPDLTERLRKIL